MMVDVWLEWLASWHCTLRGLQLSLIGAVPPLSSQQAMPPKRPGKRKRQTLIDDAAVRSGKIPHFFDYLKQEGLDQVRIAVPSFNRPSKLCSSTLSFLQRQGVAMNRIHVFVAPTPVSPETSPEWYRYMNALRDHGFEGVRLEPGGDGLTAQMWSILRWAEPGAHFVCMTDDVTDIVEKKHHSNGKPYLSPLPNGSFDAVVKHAEDLMLASDCCAWSLSASRNVLSMTTDSVSRKLGLLDGNVWGVRAQASFVNMVADHGAGVIWDVAWSVELWARGYRFFRYRSLATRTVYRLPGGMQTSQSATERRDLENAQIQKLSQKHAGLIHFKDKPNASLSTMLYSFSAVGPEPLILQRPEALTGGRRYVGFALRAMTPAERQRRRRGGQKALAAPDTGRKHKVSK